MPDIHFVGVDPRRSSIDYAVRELSRPNLDFLLSQQTPPLPVDAAQFDFVSAVSIWSHFSEDRALLWLREMGRILRPGGLLMLTMGGLGKLIKYRTQGRHSQRVFDRRTARIERGEWLFTAYPDGRRQGEELNLEHWGDATAGISWWQRAIAETFLLEAFFPAGFHGVQDIYVLRLKGKSN